MNTRLQVVRRYCCPTTRALLFAKFDHKKQTDRHTTLFPFGLRPGWTWSEDIEIFSESFDDYNMLIWIINGFQIFGSSVLSRNLTKVIRKCSQILRKLKRETWRQSAVLHLIKINMDNRIEVTALNSLLFLYRKDDRSFCKNLKRKVQGQDGWPKPRLRLTEKLFLSSSQIALGLYCIVSLE